MTLIVLCLASLLTAAELLRGEGLLVAVVPFYSLFASLCLASHLCKGLAILINCHALSGQVIGKPKATIDHPYDIHPGGTP